MSIRHKIQKELTVIIIGDRFEHCDEREFTTLKDPYCTGDSWYSITECEGNYTMESDISKLIKKFGEVRVRQSVYQWVRRLSVCKFIESEYSSLCRNEDVHFDDIEVIGNNLKLYFC